MNNSTQKNIFSKILLGSLVGLFLLLILNMSKIDKNIIHSQNVIIESCSNIGIFYFLKNLFSLDSAQIIFVDLTLRSNSFESFFNTEQIKCLGRYMSLNNYDQNTIIFGFDSYLNNTLYTLVKLVIFILFYKSPKSYLLIFNLLFDYFTVILLGVSIDLGLQIFLFIIIYPFIFLKIFPEITFYEEKMLFNQKIISALFLIMNFAFIFEKIIKEEYMIGYWLANYNYGFVKRGMVGHLLFLLSNIFNNLSLVFIINMFVTMLYIVLFYYIFWFFNIKKQSYISFILLFSPAFISFFNIDNNAIGRPEILGVITFLFFLKNYENQNNLLYAFSIIFITISLFSHSINVFIVPLIFLLQIKKNKLSLENLIKLAFLIFVVLFFIFMFLTESNTDLIATKLCADAQDLNIRENICDGAIGWLGFSTGSNINMIYFWQDGNQRYYVWYFLLFFLSLFPFIYSDWFKNNYLFVLIIFISFIPLFYLAYDWGRYIWLFIFLITTIYIYENQEPLKIINFNSKYLIVVFSSLWYLPIARGLRFDNFYQSITFRLLIVFFLLFSFVSNNYIKNEKY